MEARSGASPYDLCNDVTDREGASDGDPRFTANEIAKVEVEPVFLKVLLDGFVTVLNRLAAILRCLTALVFCFMHHRIRNIFECHRCHLSLPCEPLLTPLVKAGSSERSGRARMRALATVARLRPAPYRASFLLDPILCRSRRSYRTLHDQIVVNRFYSGHFACEQPGLWYLRLFIDEANQVHNTFVCLDVNVRRA